MLIVYSDKIFLSIQDKPEKTEWLSSKTIKRLFKAESTRQIDKKEPIEGNFLDEANSSIQKFSSFPFGDPKSH